MTKRPVAVIVLAAGKGTRMRSDRPKVLHPIAGRPMLQWAIDGAEALGPDRIGVVVGPGMETVAAAAAPHPTRVQERQAGTADAVRAARDLIDGFDGAVIVAFADTPLVRPETYRRLADAIGQAAAHPAAVAVLGMRPADPAQYGRLVVDDGSLTGIVEYLDATPDQRAIGLCNAGLMAFDGRVLPELLDAIGNDNAKGEFYLTDAVALARGRGLSCTVVEAPEDEVMGINSRADLAAAEAGMQQRLRAAAMAAGATLTDPSTVYLQADTRLGRDVTVEPSVVFGPGVVVEDGVTIRGFSHLEGVVVRQGAIIGPFARLRPGSEVQADAHVGNFVELKNTVLGRGAKANHLAYLGDSDVGAGSNVGAGTITCNYDGYLKHRTVIGENVFIGSNSALVAPVSVGDRANVAAGSVITRDVEPDALGVARARQRGVDGWARLYRERKAAEKAGQKPPSPGKER